MYNIKEITCVSALNNIKKSRLPYNHDLNVYRGCEHGCEYCFAMYTHKYMESSDFFNEIYVKTNIPEQLEKALRAKSWKKEVINLGGVTDNYQPIEETYKIMPEILKLLIKYKNPCIVSTKSDLMLRDYDLIDELSRLAYVNIAATITCMDEEIRKKIEPRGVSSTRRFEMLKQFKNTNASIGLHMMPIIPFVTDTHQNLDSIYSMGKNIGVNYVITELMNLRGITRQRFLAFAKKEIPDKYEKICELYKKGSVDRDYRFEFYKTVRELTKKYDLSLNYKKTMKDYLESVESQKDSQFTQLSLFD